MLNKDIIKEAISSMKHCQEIGSIVLQMPEDKHIIDTIIAGLEIQLLKENPNKKKCTDLNGNVYELCHISSQESKVKELEGLLRGVKDRTVPLDYLGDKNE